MKVSVIIVNHNGKKYLSKLIDSLDHQTYPAHEVIMVDNASSDDSISFIKKKYPKVIILPTDNKGFGMACNLGVSTATGDYVMFFNEDMYLPKDFIKKMVEFRKEKTKQHPYIGGIGCKIIPYEGDPKDTPDYYGGRLDLFGYPSDIKNPETQTFVINGCPFFIEKKLFQQIKGFNPNIFLYGDDSDLSWRLKLMGYDCFINNDTYAHHYGGAITGGLSPKKVAYLLYGSFIAVITNYALVTLVLLTPFYILYYLFLHIGLWITMRGSIQYNKALFKQTLRLWHDRKEIGRMRSFVQKKRVRNEWQILKNFTLIPSPLLNFFHKQVVKM